MPYYVKCFRQHKKSALKCRLPHNRIENAELEARASDFRYPDCSPHTVFEVKVGDA